MKTRLAVLAAASLFAAAALAQDKPVVVSKPIARYTADAMRKKISGETSAPCRLADKTEHLLTTEVALGGKTYRCVAVLNENLIPAGAAWTPVLP